jgi:methylaspartate mutase epsilon subunit
MGQLCPPSQLVAVSVLEALFFHEIGLRSVSVSYAQQTNMDQDREAIAALRRLCAELLPEADWHVVVYAYMGVYPRTPHGARALLVRAAELAATTGAERLIVKTVAESRRIPTIAETVAALELAATRMPASSTVPVPDDGEVYQEARALIEAVLNSGRDIGQALTTAFKRGLLDVPYCLHPDNVGRARAYIDTDGRLRWADIGALPLAGVADVGRGHRMSRIGAAEFLSALSYVQRSYDAGALEPGHASLTGELG